MTLARRIRLASASLVLALPLALAAQAPSVTAEKQSSGTTQLLIGLHAVNEQVVWATGAGGTVLRTTDGGAHWQTSLIPGGGFLAVRDVHALDSLTAWVLSIGNADSSRIYQTRDGGKTWNAQFINDDAPAFYDCLAFWDAKRAIAVSDAAHGHTPIRLTSDGGARWELQPFDKQPVADSGEGSLASSGTCVAVAGTRHAWIGTVGNAQGARVLRSTDGGRTWAASVTPIGGGAKGSSAASIAFRDERNGFAGGAKAPRVARTTDGGVTWTAVGEPTFSADIYGLAVRGAKGPLLAGGRNGLSVSWDNGEHWQAVDAGDWWSVTFASDRVAFAVGPKGQIARLTLSPAQQPSATLLLLHGKVLTVDANDRVAQAVAIAGTRIVGVGTDAEMEQLAAPNARRVDLKGRTVTPGLLDAHVHFAQGGTDQLLFIPLGYPTVKSVAEAVAAVKARVATTPVGQWVQGTGWDEGKLVEKRYITAKDLDAVSPNHPVYLEHTTGHYAVVNSAALKRAGITKDTKDPPAGTIDRAADGAPTGVLKESAQNLVRALIPDLSGADLERGIADLAKKFNAEGMTGGKDPGIDDVTWDAYQRVARAGKLSVRIFALWSGGRSVAEAKALIAKRASMTRPYESTGDDNIIAGGVKLFMDGSGGARTAWVYDPWYKNGTVLDGENRGYPAMNPDTMRMVIRMYHDAGMHVSTHAIGDKAIDWIVDSYDAALKAKPTNGLRHGIIHANMPTDRAIDAIARLQRDHDAGYPEPSASFTWWIGDLYAGTFGPQRAARLNPFHTFQSKGIIWANGSDFFVTPFPARYGLWSAVARETTLGTYGRTPFGTTEAVDVRTALRAVTIWAAHQQFLEKKTGSIEVGKYADLAVWDRNFYEVPTAQLKDAKCLMTVFNGKVVFIAEGAGFQ